MQKKLTNKKVFNLNFLITKTNIFVSITTLKRGKTIILKTSRAVGYKGTERRTLIAGQKVLRSLLNLFFEKYLKYKTYFIINLRGSNVHLQIKLVKYLIKKLNIKNILYILEKQFLTHNGCPLEIKKRRKNRNKNKIKKKR